jgi:hypothetical protein
MYYEAKTFEDLIQIMASCERLGLLYVVQKDVVEVAKKRTIGFGGKTKFETVWKLQVIQYVEEVEENETENENLQGRPSENSSDGAEVEGNEGD